MYSVECRWPKPPLFYTGYQPVCPFLQSPARPIVSISSPTSTFSPVFFSLSFSSVLPSHLSLPLPQSTLPCFICSFFSAQPPYSLSLELCLYPPIFHRWLCPAHLLSWPRPVVLHRAILPPVAAAAATLVLSRTPLLSSHTPAPPGSASSNSSFCPAHLYRRHRLSFGPAPSAPCKHTTHLFYCPVMPCLALPCHASPPARSPEVLAHV